MESKDSVEIATNAQLENEPKAKPIFMNKHHRLLRNMNGVLRQRQKAAATRAHRSSQRNMALRFNSQFPFPPTAPRKRFHNNEHDDKVTTQGPPTKQIKLEALPGCTERKEGSPISAGRNVGIVFEFEYPRLTTHRTLKPSTSEERLQILQNEVEDLGLVRATRQLRLYDLPPSPRYSSCRNSTSHPSSFLHRYSEGDNFSNEEIKSQAASYLSKVRWKAIQDTRNNNEFREKMYRAWLAKPG